MKTLSVQHLLFFLGPSKATFAFAFRPRHSQTSRGSFETISSSCVRSIVVVNDHDEIVIVKGVRPTATRTNALAHPVAAFTAYDEGAAMSIPWWQYIVPAQSMWPELFAEAFGTYLLFQLAFGVAVSATVHPFLQMGGIFPIAALTGMAVTTSVSAVSDQCAAHFNPSITWAMCLFRNFGWSKFVPYSLSQILGASLAAAINYLSFADDIARFEASNDIVRASIEGVLSAKTLACFAPSTKVAFWSEICATFLLSSTVFALTSTENKHHRILAAAVPTLVGLTVSCLICLWGPISGASMNPARELGPRLVLMAFGWSSSAFHQVGQYLIAPMLGSTMGGAFVDRILYQRDTDR